MVEFGKKLLKTRYEPWADYYLDYQGLKAWLSYQKKLQQTNINDALPPVPPPPLRSAILRDMDSCQRSHQEEEDPETGSPSHQQLVAPAGSFHTSSPALTQGSHSTTAHILTVMFDPSSPSCNVTRDFESLLQDEIEKIGLFFLQIQGEVATELAQSRRQQAEFLWTQRQQQQQSPAVAAFGPSVDSILEEIRSLYTEYHPTACQLLHLVHFVEQNVTGLRKILKKHDKITKRRLTFHYFTAAIHAYDHHLHFSNMLLYQYEGIAALYTTFHTALRELKSYELEVMRQADRHQRHRSMVLEAGPKKRPSVQPAKPPLHPAATTPTAPSSSSNHPQGANSLPTFFVPATDVAKFLEDEGFIGGSSNNHHNQQRSSYESTQDPTAEISTADITAQQLDAVLLQVEAARRRLTASQHTFQELLAAQMNMGDPLMEEEEEEAASVLLRKSSHEIQDKWVSHLLNLISTFLYMTNYYVVAPTSGQYAAMLGSDEAMAGIIIGMTPIAALVSTVLYSWWTSHSYKAALLFASTCSVVGNICYGLGLPYHRLSLVMLGRLLNGFGSARSINRRYIADTFPPRQRTEASAHFVTAGALGMAAGPAIASLLHIGSPPEHISASNGDKVAISTVDIMEPVNVWWTPQNSPGWFMFVVWSMYWVLLLVYFEDPPNRHKPAVPERRMVKTTTTSSTGTVESVSAYGESSRGSAGEGESLLGTKDNLSHSDSALSASSEEEKEVPLWRNIPVMTTFIVYFVLKLVLECVLSSTATLTNYYFNWDSSISGVYLAFLGLLMLPANMAIAYGARTHEDKELIVFCEIAMFLGCVGVLKYSDTYAATQYLIFSVLMFLSTNALEGPNMSLLSKTIPRSWSRGIFNVGLLATEAGTLGRAVGDVLLSMWAYRGIDSLLNDAFRSMSIWAGFSLLLTLYFFEHLEPHEKDD